MLHHQQRSLRALNWINSFMADVNTGIGPFLAIYLTATRHWNPASVGVVISAQSIASVVAQSPAGWLVDRSQQKNWLIVGGAVAVALGCLGIVLAPNQPTELLTQVLIGIAAAILPPTIAAISLEIVGKRNLSRRVGRNETFNHVGNVVFALLAGTVGTWLGQQWIFYTSAIVAAGAVAAAASIRPEDIDNEVARAATVEEDTGGQSKTPATIASFTSLLRKRRLWIFTASVVLFHFANAAMLPWSESCYQKARTGNPRSTWRLAL